MWDLIVSVPDHCLSFHFGRKIAEISSGWFSSRFYSVEKVKGR